MRGHRHATLYICAHCLRRGWNHYTSAQYRGFETWFTPIRAEDKTYCGKRCRRAAMRLARNAKHQRSSVIRKREKFKNRQRFRMRA